MTCGDCWYFCSTNTRTGGMCMIGCIAPDDTPIYDGQPVEVYADDAECSDFIDIGAYDV